MTQHTALTSRTWIEIALLALIWGGSFLAMRVALDSIGPLWIVAHRTLWAALVLWAVVRLAGHRTPRGLRLWGAFFVMGLMNNVVPFGLIAWGQGHIETGLAGIINASTAVWGVMFAALLLPDERLTGRRLVGVLLGFAGVSLAIGVEALRNFDLRSLGQLAIVGAALSYAISGVWARKTLSGVTPQVAAAGMVSCSTVISLVLAIAIEGPPNLALTPGTWTAIAYFSVMATAIAYLLYYRILAAAGSGNTMLVTLVVAPVAIVLGALFRGEGLTLSAYSGFALLALGLIVIDGRALDKFPLARGRADR